MRKLLAHQSKRDAQALEHQSKRFLEIEIEFAELHTRGGFAHFSLAQAFEKLADIFLAWKFWLSRSIQIFFLNYLPSFSSKTIVVKLKNRLELQQA